jgi:acyl transferase domain-containing protein/NAD(P)-dependent dehydrogenase (short-subunit alcohol dehydrogenase family)/acyl carrier protein
MENTAHRAIAIVGVGAVLPDAPNVTTFWDNIKNGRYSITDVSPERWDPQLYYDADPSVPDKTYSKIGGWVRESKWDPIAWRLPIPPRVAEAMDGSQKWGIACTRDALEDYGYPKRPLNLDRTAVILGNAMGGEHHYFTILRLYFPEYARELEHSASFASLPESVRHQITRELHGRMGATLPEVTEDTMPGELSNCIAGRIANIFNFHGPNYVVDAACASAMAAITAAAEGLVENDFDVAVTGGIDRNMGASTFIKFSKIGALSASGTRPYAEGADGFVMGEGAAIFLLKRLADAERDHDKIYAVLRGMGGSSDGKGKGITAPNPIGQKFAIERAWHNAGLSPSTAGLIEGHGTSTKVGDVVEVQSITDVLASFNLPQASVALGSVKSNIGHLKGAAGAAGLLKAVLALRDQVLPPSVHCERRNPDIDFAHSPLYVNTELKPWIVPPDATRRAGLSAFGFGGTNFHAVLEEYIPGRLNGNGKKTIAVGEIPSKTETSNLAVKMATTTPVSAPTVVPASNSFKAPLRGALVLGAPDKSALQKRLRKVQEAAAQGKAPEISAPAECDLRAAERIAIDYIDAADLADKSGKALKALTADLPAVWKALRAQGIYRGKGAAPKVAFLYTGQGSQYVNMLRPLLTTEPIVAETFAEADRIMTPLLGKPLTDFIFVNGADEKAVAKAEDDLRQTAITQPAVLATDESLTRLLAAYGIRPDMTMGHSLGEYGALVASGAMPFHDALEAVSARGRGMTAVAMKDNGKMAAVFAPITEIERILKTVDGYVVIANINSNTQGVIGGASKAVEQAMELFLKAGYDAVALPVSHAFHTSIVAGAGEPLRKELERLHLRAPQIPIVANVDGEFYPMGTDVVPKMLDILTRQVAAPVQFIKGLRTLYAAGARIFVEVGPKKALQGFAEDVLGESGDVVSLFTNHPKTGDIPSFNQALCALYAAGLGRGITDSSLSALTTIPITIKDEPFEKVEVGPLTATNTNPIDVGNKFTRESTLNRDDELAHIFGDALERARKLYDAQPRKAAEPVVITGAALGLPGTEHIFDDANIGRILRGDQFIDAIPTELRGAMLDKHITRLVKSKDGGGEFETINHLADVIKLAGRGRTFDLEAEFGVNTERVLALDRVTRLAIAAGIDALRDAGIPLVMRYKKTSKGTTLPDRWVLPDALRDDTGVIFASAFPGYNSFAEEMRHYYTDRARREQITVLEDLLSRIAQSNGHYSVLREELERRIAELRAVVDKAPYLFDRRFLFRTLAMGHSQFAEFIGARGPNTQINAACASTTQAVGLAEDWIREQRCRRVIIVSADDVTSDEMMGWFGAGFLATGAAATDEVVEDAAIPFDRRRHGMIIGMGAAAIVVESGEAIRERGIRPICEVLSAVTANSAFHGTRLDVQHIGSMMEDLIAKAETRYGIARQEIAARTVFVSHETYTPARGGSASAEIFALRRVFGDVADRIVIANTKGFTGHAMATGIEDVVAIKSLETGCVPPVANFKEVDPELGALNLSKGGRYPIEYALRLGAGFGSQISMTLCRWTPSPDNVHPKADSLGYSYRIENPALWNGWLCSVSGRADAELEVIHRTLRVRDQAVTTHRIQPVQTTAVPVGVQTKAEDVTPVKVVDKQIEKKPDAIREVPVAKSVVPSITKSSEEDGIKEKILAIVAEKTGYPVEMLDLDLDLEADLGVDTVKQAEVFASVREAYGIARDDQIKLRDFPTLAHVIRFVRERQPGLESSATPETLVKNVPVPLPQPSVELPRSASSLVSEDSVKERLLTLVVEKTGYPKDMLDLDLDLEADLGVDTVKQAEMFAAIRELYSIPRDENRKLRDYPTLAHVIRFVYEKRPDLATPPASIPVTQPEVSAAEPATEKAPAWEEKVSSLAPVEFRNSVQDRVLTLVVDKTGYPKDMLDLDLDLEADLGIDTVKQAEMFAAIREIYSIPRDENRKLRDYPTLAHVIRFVFEKRPDLAEINSPPTGGILDPSVPAAVVVGESLGTAEALVSDDSIKERVLEIVAEKTGYPKDMLDLDLDLEADLGIDTVKQAEMFASVRAAFNIPRDGDLKLHDFPTLAHVIKFARDRRPITSTTLSAAATVIDTPIEISKASPTPPVSVASFEATNRIPRRVPVPTLRPPLAMCKSTGVTLEAGRRVVIMPDKNGVAEALTTELKKQGVEVLRFENIDNADTLTKQLDRWLATGPVHGIYWLPALDADKLISEMNFADWKEALWIRIKAYYAVMRALYQQIAAPGTFLVSATRLGGQHGYDQSGAVSPLGGAVVGFTKTYKRERVDALVKAVDFEPDRNPTEIARGLLNETLRDPGAVEIGYRNDLRWAIGLAEQSAADGQPGIRLDKGTVFVIAGAAGSIVSAITSDLAAASGGKFYLLDLVPEPDADNPDLLRFTRDKENLKRDLFARIQARGERATPVLVEKELAALERAHAAMSAINAVRAAGGTAHYFSLNLTDFDSVTKVIDQVRKKEGRIDVLLHAAGIERSHFLPDKDSREFDLVFDVKSDGWFNLLKSIGDMPVGATIAFSSIAGRFGNAGQADYSSANDLLCKITSSLRRTHPATRGIAIDWTAWGGIGMATRGSIPKMMEVAAIDMLSPEAGIPLIRRELSVGGTRGEIVIGERLGAMLNEWDPTGGLDPAIASREDDQHRHGPLIESVSNMTVNRGLTVNVTLDPKVQPFLFDHKIDGVPILPGVMGLEAFAEAALSVLPGWNIQCAEDVEFLAPFKFYRDEPRTLTVEAEFSPEKGSAVLASCRLIGQRTLPNQAEPQSTTHFTARIRLSKDRVELPSLLPIRLPDGTPIEAGEIYRLYFHGPAYQVVKRAWWDGTRIVGLMNSNLPHNHQPANRPLAMMPRLIELCFQTAGLWEMGMQGRMGLPRHIDRVQVVQNSETAIGPLYALVTPNTQRQMFEARVIDAKGSVYLILDGYRTVALPEAINPERLKALQAMMSPHPVAA